MNTVVHFSLSSANLLNVGRIRVASLLLAALIPTASPISADTCLSAIEYASRGGHLDLVGRSKFYESIPSAFFSCGRIGCRGEVDLSGVVNPDGSIRDVKITQDNYGPGGEPDRDLAEILRRWLASVRTRPPRLNGKAVCVKRDWRFRFEEKAEPSNQ